MRRIEPLLTGLPSGGPCRPRQRRSPPPTAFCCKTCLERVLKLYREWNLTVLNMEITRDSSSEKHSACAIFSLRLNRKTNARKILAELGQVEGMVSVEEL